MDQIRRGVNLTDEARKIAEIVRGHRLPNFINDFTLEFGLDSVDEPAVWVVLLANNNVPADKLEADRWGAEYASFTNAVREKVLDNQIAEFPYFRIVPFGSREDSKV